MSEKQQKVFEKLDSLNIKYKAINHDAVFTIEDMEKLKIDNINEIAKNLFLRDDKAKSFFLIVLQKDKKANLKLLRQQLKSRPLSFASEDYLKSFLDLEKGAVTPFGILNDEACTVEVVFDKDLALLEYIGVHPNENTATVFLHLDDLIKLIEKHGNKVTIIDII